LNRALDKLNVSEHELCFVNALNLNWGETSVELKSLTDRTKHRWKRVVALGRTAATHLHQLGYAEDKDFVAIPHPQWARRFKYWDPDGYAKILGEAMGIKENT